jgi:DNA-binding transcriptional regulator PaaX
VLTWITDMTAKSADAAMFDVYVSIVGASTPLAALRILYLHGRGQRAIKLKNATDRNRARSAFSYLLSKGYIEFKAVGGTATLLLTDKGVRKVRSKLFPDLIDQVAGQDTRHWDGKWRIILFDIPTEERVKRNAFRTFIKRLGATMVQKSVWIYPHDCSKEVRMLADFFELTPHQMRIVTAEDIGEDAALKRRYKLGRSNS